MALRVARALAVAGASASLCGCGGGDDKAPTPAPPTPASPTPSAPAPTAAPPTPAGPVQKAWDNHFDAFAKANAEGLDQIMKDYDEQSVLSVFNINCEGQLTTLGPYGNMTGFKAYEGTVAIRGFFSSLFTQLKNDISPGGSNVVPTELTVTEAADNEYAAANVFLAWTADKADPVIEWATDSFGFRLKDEPAYITKQNIVVNDGSPCEPSFSLNGVTKTDITDVRTLHSWCEADTNKDKALCVTWDNQLKMRLAKQASLLLGKYTDKSVIQVFDAREKTKKVYTLAGGAGTTGTIESMYTELFSNLGQERFEVRVLEVDEDTSTMFWVWTSDAVPQVGETFILDGQAKILTHTMHIFSKARQMVV